MAATYTLIESYTVGAGGASSVTLGSGGTIPNTYTDLLVKLSARNTTANGVIYFSFNGSTSSRSSILLYGDGSAAGSVSYNNTDPRVSLSTQSDYTASTFSNGEIYIPNYAGNNNKSLSADTVQENNGVTNYSYLIAGLWSNTSAITSITLTPISGNFAQYSTFYLYGIKSS